jgi:hypothetical protein
LDDGALRSLWEQCAKLLEGLTLSKSLLLAQAISLGPTFSRQLPYMTWMLSPGEALSDPA